MTDVLGGINFGVGCGSGLLILMIAEHLRRRLVLNEAQQRTALKHLFFIGLFSAVERITFALLSTPSNIRNVDELNLIIYVVPVASRFLIGVSVWATIRWVFFVYWPAAERRK